MVFKKQNFFRTVVLVRGNDGQGASGGLYPALIHSETLYELAVFAVFHFKSFAAPAACD